MLLPVVVATLFSAIEFSIPIHLLILKSACIVAFLEMMALGKIPSKSETLRSPIISGWPDIKRLKQPTETQGARLLIWGRMISSPSVSQIVEVAAGPNSKSTNSIATLSKDAESGKPFWNSSTVPILFTKRVSPTFFSTRSNSLAQGISFSTITMVLFIGVHPPFFVINHKNNRYFAGTRAWINIAKCIVSITALDCCKQTTSWFNVAIPRDII